MQPTPFLTDSCPSGAYSASSYASDVAQTQGWNKPSPVMVHRPTVSDVLGGISSVPGI